MLLCRSVLLMKAEIVETVMFYDTDCGGVVSNIAYLKFVEKARSALFGKLGMPVSGMNDSQLFPAVVRTEIDYLSPAKLGDEVHVTAQLTSVEKVKSICAFELSVTDGTGKTRTLGKAQQQVVLVQMPSGRPRRTPEEWAAQVT